MKAFCMKNPRLRRNVWNAVIAFCLLCYAAAVVIVTALISY